MRNFICKVFAIVLLITQATTAFAAYIPDGKYSEGDSTPSPVKGSAIVGDDSGTLSALDIIAGKAQVDANITNGSVGVFGDSNLPISGMSAALAVGTVDGSGNQNGITGNPMIVEPTATVTVPASGAGTAIAAAIVDASGNQITSFGGGTQYTENATPPTDMIGTAIAGRYTTSNTIEIANVSDLGDSNFAIISGPVTGALWTHAQVKLDIGGNTLAQTGKTVGSENAASVAIVDGSGNQVTSFGGGTEYTEDSAAAADPVGGVQILVRADTPTTITDTDGDNVAQRGTNYGAAYVQVVNSSGSFVDTFGGGTEYSVANTPPADPVGGTLLFETSVPDWQNVGVGGGNGAPLPVGIYDNAGNQIGISGSPLEVTGGGGGTQYAEGDALGSTPTGTLLIGRKFSDDTAEGVTVGTASTKRPMHVHTIDANGDIRPPATLYQQSDTSNTADLAPGIAWKDADGTGNWHVTSIDDPLPIQIATSSYFPSQLTDSGNFKSSVDEYSNASVTSSGAVCTMTGIGGASTALIEVTGTFTASIIPQVSVDNGSNYTSIGLLKGAWTLYDIHRGTWHYEINRPGIYQVNISGANAFRLNCAAYTSGTATVRAAVTSAPTAFKSKVNTQNAAINITSGSGSGNKTIISAVAGYKIRVTGFWFMTDTATTVQFKDGSSGSVLSGPLAVPVTGGIVVPKTADGDCVIETDGSSNTAMVLVIGTAANVGGTVYYSLVEA